MNRPALLVLLVLLALTAGCPFIPVVTTDAGTDSGTPGDGGTGGSLGNDAGFGAPITAPSETWTYIEFPDAKCGNGTTTGIAVNLTARSSRLILYLQGGGACWDAATCYILKSASHLEDTVQEATALSEARALPYLFDRTNPANPFRDASFIYVPYCTGDLHGGTHPTTYSALGQTRTAHHVGANNLLAYLARIVPTFPTADRVWLAGASAGGFGAVINWWRVQAAFGPTRVDVLDDSGDFVEPGDNRYLLMRDAWGLALPPGCDACDAGFTGWLPHYDGRFPNQRLALMTYRQDGVIRAYFNLDIPTFEARIDALRAAMGTRQRGYYVEGTQHVLLGQSPFPRADGGMLLTDWLTAFTSDDAGFVHQGP